LIQPSATAASASPTSAAPCRRAKDAVQEKRRRRALHPPQTRLTAQRRAEMPLVLISAVALIVDRGIFQFGGAGDLAGGVPPLVWIVAASIVMMRTPSPRRVRSSEP